MGVCIFKEYLGGVLQPWQGRLDDCEAKSDFTKRAT